MEHLGKATFDKGILSQIIAIFFIQASSTIAFAVFYSGLSIFLTKNQNFSQEHSAYITGLFLSFNYFLPLVGGFIANRVITYKRLYVIGTLSSILGCIFFINHYLYFGLALFLMGSLSNVCLKMFLTQLFSANQKIQRRIAFTWNYTGINLGFMLGYFLTGFSTLNNKYIYLFIMMIIFIIISLLIGILFIKEPKLQIKINVSLFKQIISCLLITLLLVLIIDILFHFANVIHTVITMLMVIIFLSIMFYAFKTSAREEQKNIVKFIYFASFQIIFWTGYMLSPIAIIQLIETSVQRNLFNITLAPQWFANIDSLIILIFAPMLTVGIKNIKIFNEPSNYFTLGFLCLFIGFSIMTLGLHFSHGEKISLYIALSYLLLVTLGEIFIAPISDSFIGEYIPESLRGLMTGASRVVLCIGVLFSSGLSNKFILPYINKSGLTLSNSLQLAQFFLVSSFLILALLVLITPLLNSNKTRMQAAIN